MDSTTHQIIVIGGGPGGEAASAHAARTGADVVLVERELVGGECPYWGCMPSKAMLRPSQALAETLRVPGAAEAVTGPLDVDALFARRDEVVRGLDDSSHAQRIESTGVTIVRGHGRLTGERAVEVEAADGTRRALVATNAVILAPGSRAAMPPIDGLADARPWTNREATLADHAPRRLVALGGGVISVELAQAFAALGSDVTILEQGERILTREEPEAAALVATSLVRAGITIRTGVATTRVDRASDGTVTLTLANGETIACDELLVATGRQGNAEDLGLETVGVTATKRGTITVTDCMRVPDVDWLYVVGDATGRAQLTHAAVYQAKVAARNALGLETHCVEDNVAAPRVMFTEPHVAAVGHTMASAEQAGLHVRAFDRDPQRVAAGSFHGSGSDGFARIILDLDTTCVVGATFVAPDIAELLHSATIAIVGEVPLERLRHCVAPFPTRSEVWTKLIELIDRDPDLAQR